MEEVWMGGPPLTCCPTRSPVTCVFPSAPVSYSTSLRVLSGVKGRKGGAYPGGIRGIQRERFGRGRALSCYPLRSQHSRYPPLDLVTRDPCVPPSSSHCSLAAAAKVDAPPLGLDVALDGREQPLRWRAVEHA